MKIKFCGGTGRVTGSSFLLDTGKNTVLIDCGMFQGSAETRGKNLEKFPFDPKKVGAMIATHSHIDHIGRIPKLFRDGFSGTVYSTKPVKDFAKIFLEDTFKIMQNDARRNGQEKMIWDRVDLEKALKNWVGFDYHVPFWIEDSLVEFLDAGHILGSALVKVIADKKTVIFTGDIGNPPAPIVEDTEKVDYADYIVMESTYGDRDHEKSEERLKKLQAVLEDVITKKGVLLIPAFAMEKTQELLYELNDIVESKKIGRLSFFVDSPLAIKATEIYTKYPQYFDWEARKTIRSGDDIFNFPGLKVCRTSQESRRIHSEPNPKVIMAGSGMSNGGRILEHEATYLPDPNNAILFVGYQVKGTLGRRIKDGESVVKISGREIEVNAMIKELSAYSSHADQTKLLAWLKNFSDKKNPPKRVFVVHGEPPASAKLAEVVKEKLKIDTYVPKENEEVIL